MSSVLPVRRLPSPRLGDVSNLVSNDEVDALPSDRALHGGRQSLFEIVPSFVQCSQWSGPLFVQVLYFDMIKPFE